MGWENHDIKDKDNYYDPWKYIMKFINDIHKTFKIRFSLEEFLEVLDIIDLRIWNIIFDYKSDFSISLFEWLLMN
jgi:hypothetical protein